MTTVRVISAAGLALIEDGGRPGHMHEGVPPGGAMVPALLAAANRAAGNPPGAAAIEVHGAIAVEASVPLQAATTEELVMLAPGAAVRVIARGRPRVEYLAVAGGLEVPAVLGSRGTLLVAGLGGHEGRALRAGDVLRVGGDAGTASPPRPPTGLGAGGELRVILGPDSGDTAALLGGTFTVTSVGDRTGVRLAGPVVRARKPAGLSAPMVRGAIQTTPSGELVVLGPDHPTTGGYPVIAVVLAADLDLVLAARPGVTFRFRAPPTRTRS